MTIVDKANFKQLCWEYATTEMQATVSEHRSDICLRSQKSIKNNGIFKQILINNTRHYICGVHGGKPNLLKVIIRDPLGD